MRALPPLLALLFVAGCVDVKTPIAPETPAPALPAIVERQLTPTGVSASEVSAAPNPKDPKNIVAAANSAGGFGVYWTKDAGETWTASSFPAARVAPLPNGMGRFSSASDPAVAFAPDGTVYLAGLSIIPTSGVFVTKSTNGGESWADAKLVHESDLAASFNDKEWIGVSPKGTIIVVWQKEPLLDSLRTVDGATGVDADIGDIVFSRSTDGGNSWSLPGRVSRGLHNNGTQVAFTADGRGHMLWVNYETSTLDYVSSGDDGATWSTPKEVVKIKYSGPLPRYSRMHTLPGFAASPTGPTLAAIWHDARNKDLDVFAVASPDGGATWTSAVRVHDDPINNNAHQLYPWITVAPDGRIHASFYDPRPDVAHPYYGYFVATAAGPDLRFGAPVNASLKPFTVFTGTDSAGRSESRGLGDYTAIVSTTAGVFPVWADGRLERSSVFSSRVPPELLIPG